MKLKEDFTVSFFAEFYDILHAGLSDVDAYVRLAQQYGPRVLELGSGTGRILLPLAAAGFYVTGVDSSLEMLNACRAKLLREGSDLRNRVRLVQADVLEMDLGEAFDLVIAPCNMLNHFLTAGDALKMLRSAAKHLSSSGTFVLENSVPDLPHMVRTSGVNQTFEFTHPLTGTTIEQSVTASYDFAEQVEVDVIVLREFDDGRLIREESARQTLTYYHPREVRLLLESAGLEIVKESGSLDADAPIGSDYGLMVFTCKKNPKDPCR